jgi:hypothetical protein
MGHKGPPAGALLAFEDRPESPLSLLSIFFFADSVTSATAIIPPPAPASEPLVWQARRDSNPQPPVLETGAPPIELLACCYFVSLCDVCLRQLGQYLLSSSRSVVFFLFFVVE